MPSSISFWSDEKLERRIDQLEKAGAPRIKYGALPPLLAERENRRFLRANRYAPYQVPADDKETPKVGPYR